MRDFCSKVVFYVYLTAANIVLSGQTVPAGSAPSIVVNTHKGNAAGLSSMTSSHFAAINQRMQAKIPTSIVQVQTVSTQICPFEWRLHLF